MTAIKQVMSIPTRQTGLICFLTPLQAPLCHYDRGANILGTPLPRQPLLHRGTS